MQSCVSTSPPRCGSLLSESGRAKAGAQARTGGERVSSEVCESITHPQNFSESRGRKSTSGSMVYLAPSLRRSAVAFLIYIAKICKSPPTTKYCSLCFFESRFLPRMESLSESECKEALRRDKLNLYPLQACNLQILALVSFWIASKIHETKAVSVEQLRKLASSHITDQHFTKNDFIEAKISRVFMSCRRELAIASISDSGNHFDEGSHSHLSNLGNKVSYKEVDPMLTSLSLQEIPMPQLPGIKFDLTTGPLMFYAMDELLVKLRKEARVGKLVKLQTCVTIIDLLYDLDPKELNLRDISVDEISSAILAVAYILSVPIEKCNFALLSWLSRISGSKIQQSEIEHLTRKIFCSLFDEMVESKEFHSALIEDIPGVETTFDQEASSCQDPTEPDRKIE